MKAITPHYIDGKFVEPHGREVMDNIRHVRRGLGFLCRAAGLRRSNSEWCRSRIRSIRNRGFS